MKDEIQTVKNSIKNLMENYYEAKIVKPIEPGLRYSKDIYHFKNKHVITSVNLLQDTNLFMLNISPLICIPCHDIHIIFNPFISNLFNIESYKKIINTIALIIDDEWNVIIYFNKESKAFRYFIESELRNKCKKVHFVKFKYLPKSLKFCIQEKTNHADKRYLELYTDEDFTMHERIIIKRTISCQYTFRKNYYEFMSSLKEYKFPKEINAPRTEMKEFIIDEFKNRNNKNIIASFPDDDSIWEYINENEII